MVAQRQPPYRFCTATIPDGERKQKPPTFQANPTTSITYPNPFSRGFCSTCAQNWQQEAADKISVEPKSICHNALVKNLLHPSPIRLPDTIHLTPVITTF